MELIVNVGELDTKTIDGFEVSPYAFKFDENSPMWDKSREVNEYYLKHQQNYFNERLRYRGYLFLNEVYDQLGVTRTKIGQVCGWVFDPENPNIDNYVDLGISDERNDNEENVFILDPNVDGCILDKI